MSDSTLQAKGNAIYVETTQDWQTTPALGKLVTFSGGVPSINASTTVPAVAVVLDARTRTAVGVTTYMNSLGILGGMPGPMRGLIDSGSVPLFFGDRVMQAASGALTKEVTGSPRVVVGIVTDENGANPGDLTEITFITPCCLTY
jgi:hypothetical protein